MLESVESGTYDEFVAKLPTMGAAVYDYDYKSADGCAISKSSSSRGCRTAQGQGEDALRLLKKKRSLARAFSTWCRPATLTRWTSPRSRPSAPGVRPHAKVDILLSLTPQDHLPALEIQPALARR